MKLARKLTAAESADLSRHLDEANAFLAELEKSMKQRNEFQRLHGEVALEIGGLRERADGSDFEVVKLLGDRERQLSLLGESLEKCEEAEGQTSKTARLHAQALLRAIKPLGDELIAAHVAKITKAMSPFYRLPAEAEAVAMESAAAKFVILQFSPEFGPNYLAPDELMSMEGMIDFLFRQARRAQSLLAGDEIIPDFVPAIE